MISKEKKTAIMQEYARKEGDTGSPEVQIAVLTERIRELTEHIKVHPKDQEKRHRGIPCTDQEARHQKVIDACRILTVLCQRPAAEAFRIFQAAGAGRPVPAVFRRQIPPGRVFEKRRDVERREVK